MCAVLINAIYRQRWYVWDILENNKLDYERVALVDVDTMIRWDAPNFFDLTDFPKQG